MLGYNGTNTLTEMDLLVKRGYEVDIVIDLDVPGAVAPLQRDVQGLAQRVDLLQVRGEGRARLVVPHLHINVRAIDIGIFIVCVVLNDGVDDSVWVSSSALLLSRVLVRIFNERAEESTYGYAIYLI
jgi:hypothetical protein